MGRDDDQEREVSRQAECSSGGEELHRELKSRKRRYSSSRRRGRSPFSIEERSSRGASCERYDSSSSRHQRHRSRRRHHRNKYKKERSASSPKEEVEYSDRDDSSRRNHRSYRRRRHHRRRQSSNDDDGGNSFIGAATSSDYYSSSNHSPSGRHRRNHGRRQRRNRSSSASPHRGRRHRRRRSSFSCSSLSSEEQQRRQIQQQQQQQQSRRRKRQRKQHRRHSSRYKNDDDDYSKSSRSSRRRHSRRRHSPQHRSKRYHDNDRDDDMDSHCSWSSHASHRHRRRRRRHRSTMDHSKKIPKKRPSSSSSVLSYQQQRSAQNHPQIAQAPQPVSEDEASHHHNVSSSKDVDDSYGHFEGGPGTIICSQYKLIRDVGLGTFGRVVEARDMKKNNSKVAIKIVRNVKRYHESAWIEADIVQNVNSRGGRGRSLVSILHNRFDWKGHACLVFECLGPSLYDFLKMQDYRPFPLYCIRHFATQLLHALDFIHSFGLIHTDLKPENILLTNHNQITYRNWDNTLQQVPASTNIKVIDFGGSTYDYEKKSSVINTRQYRAPEVILGLGWSMPSDLWSAGCIIAELYIGELLFATHDNTEHLALIERAIGRFPLDVLAKARHNCKNNSNNNQSQTAPSPHTYFDSYGWHKMNAVLSPSSLSHVRKMGPLESLVADHDKPSGLTLLLRSLLTIDPNFRGTAKHILQICSFCSPT